MALQDRPELADVIDLAEQNTHVSINVCVLGEVVRYHAPFRADPPSVDVQLVARPITRDGTRYSEPVITRVPIAYPSFGPIVIRAVPEVGDGLMCHVFDRDILGWLANGKGGTFDPGSRRTHDKNDIVAVPCMRPNRRTPISTDEARQIYIGDEGGRGTFIKLNVQTGAVVVEGTKVNLGAGATPLQGNARVGDTVATGASMATWIAAITAAVASPTPVVVPPPIDFGKIATGSTKVFSE